MNAPANPATRRLHRHREEHHEAELGCPPSTAPRADDDAHGQAVDEAHQHLLAHHPEQTVRRDQAEGQPAHRHRERLGSGVAAHAGDDRHPRRRGPRPRERVLEEIDHAAGEERGEQVDESQGSRLLTAVGPGAASSSSARHAAESQHVLGGLRLDHVDHVVEGDPAEQPPGRGPPPRCWAGCSAPSAGRLLPGPAPA